jgi:hypothetical protein
VGLVAYSVTIAGDHVPRELVRQLEISFGTLRAHNPSQPVVLFSQGRLPPVLAPLCVAADVMVHEQPPYEARLRRLCPTGWRALSAYPTLHKFLNFAALAGSGFDQVLCCDCDTVFAGDDAGLFARYRDVSRHGTVTERKEPAEEPDTARVLTER